MKLLKVSHSFAALPNQLNVLLAIRGETSLDDATVSVSIEVKDPMNMTLAQIEEAASRRAIEIMARSTPT